MGKRIALVIGTCTYEDPQFAALAAPVHDVKGLALTLRDPKVGGFDEVHELVDRTSRDLQLEISNVFADREKDDLVVVYISGHGYKDRGKLYFICKDTRRNRLNATGVPSDYLKQEMEASAARRQVLILDCCHSGAFSAGMKSSAVVGDKAGAVEELGGDESGKIVLTASDAIQYAYEGDTVSGAAQNSVFTKHLLEGLRTGAADMDGDGTISVDELFDYVRLKVREERPDQRPQRSAAGESGDVFIAKSPYVKPAELSKDLLDGTRSKDRLVVMGSIDDLQRLLEDPDPRMVAAARQRLQEMLLEDNFRSVLDKVQEALDSVKVNVVVKQKAARVRTGPAGPGSAGWTEVEPEPEAPAGPWLRQGTGPGLVDVVLIRAGERRVELAKAIGAATGAGQKDAETFIKDAPHAAFPKLNQADARRLVEELERCGATVEVRPVKSRSSGDPESSVWMMPKVKVNPDALRDVRHAEPERRPQAERHAREHGPDPRDCGPGNLVVNLLVTGGGWALATMIASATVHGMLYSGGNGLEQAQSAGMIMQGIIVGPAMAFGMPMGWGGPHKIKRIGVGIAWALIALIGAGVSGWTSRDQPGMSAGRARGVFGVWFGAIVLGLGMPTAFATAMQYSVAWVLLSTVLAGAGGAVGVLSQGAILSGARRAAAGR